MPSTIHISAVYRDALASVGLDSVDRVFADARLRVWRDLEDRDNSTLDATVDGRAIRLHVKRDKRVRREPMALEARGITLLESVGVPSAPLVAHGSADDGRTFVITENLDGYTSADRLIEGGGPRGAIFDAMADVAARLHRGGLHHRDLYANHFYLRPAVGGGHDVRLIDTARVRRLPRLVPGRWVVKDVGQLIFSVAGYAGGEGILRRYCEQTGRRADGWFARRVRAKAAWIDRHDRALRAKRPTRNLRLSDGN